MSSSLLIEICEIYINNKVINSNIIEKMARFYNLKHSFGAILQIGYFIFALRDSKIKAMLLVALDEYIRPTDVSFRNSFMCKYLADILTEKF